MIRSAARTLTLAALAALLLPACQSEGEPGALAADQQDDRPPRTPEDDLLRRLNDMGPAEETPSGGAGGEAAGGAGGELIGGSGGSGGSPGGSGGAVGGAELCDGADNDGDGVIDEGTAGGACSTGEGLCATEGTLRCEGGAQICDAEAIEPGFESCDGLDNDCDGAVDENFDDGRVCCSTDDHCAAGQLCQDQTCVGGGAGGSGGGGSGGAGGGAGAGGAGGGGGGVAGCGSAQALNGPGSVIGVLPDAGTLQGSCSLLSGGELVHTLQVNSQQRVLVDTEGSLVDTVLYVQTQCGDLLSEIACNDDRNGLFSPSELEFIAEPGVQYFIVVDTLIGGGLYQLNVTYLDVDVTPSPECAVDADCGAGQCVSGECVDAPAPVADACDAPTAINGSGDYAGSTANGGATYAGSCGRSAASPEQAFLIQPERSGLASLSLDADFDTVMYVRTACEGAEVSCDDDSGAGNASALSFEATAGQAYYVFVDGYNGASGAFTLRYDAPLAAVGDTCVGAQALGGFGDHAGDTANGLSEQMGSCTFGGASPEQSWTFSVDVAQPVSLELVEASFDTVLYVRTDCEDEETEVACDDDSGEGLKSALTFDAEPGVLYSVIVDGYNGANGTYTLSFSSGN